MRSLALTTPLMKGDDVRRLQKALRNNEYGDFLQGAAIDGEYGQLTASAVFRAKHWLGYLKPDKRAAELLLHYLEGKKPLTAEMKARRRKRIDAQSETPLRLKALKRARTYIGIKEQPANSNRCEISRWYGLIGPWCMMTMTKAYVEAGSKVFRRGSFSASCEQVIGACRAGKRGLAFTKDPKPGDLVFLKWPGMSHYSADHVEMVEEVSPRLKTIGGNTSPDKAGSQANGGMCCRKDREDERRAGIVRYYIRVSE